MNVDWINEYLTPAPTTATDLTKSGPISNDENRRNKKHVEDNEDQCEAFNEFYELRLRI